MSYWCESCKRTLQANQIEEVRSGTGFLPVCPNCARAVFPAALPGETRPLKQVSSDPLLDALSYPSRSGLSQRLVKLGLGLGFSMYLPGGAELVMVVALAVFVLLLRSTADAGGDLEDVTDRSRPLADKAADFTRYLLVSLVPLALLGWAVFPVRKTVAAAFMAFLLASATFPAAAIAAHRGAGWVGGLDPRPVLEIIVEHPRAYFTDVLRLGIAWLVAGFLLAAGRVQGILDLDVSIPILPGFLTPAFDLGAMAVPARYLGRLARRYDAL